jgi:hypothetical protein
LAEDLSDILSAMRMGTAYKQVIKVRKLSVTVRPLTIGETVEIAGEVVDELTKLSSSNRNPIMEHALLAQKTLVKASTSAPGAKDPKLTEFEVANMTPDELHMLYKEYTAAVERVNPSMETMEAKEFDALVAELKKNDPGFQPIDLSFCQLANMVRFFLTKAE